MSDEILNSEDFPKILTAKLNTKNFEVISNEWLNLSDNIEGYMGDHYILKLTYKIGNTEESSNFFVKTKTIKTELQMQTITEANSFEKEIFIYKFRRELEKKGFKVTFFPNMYYNKGFDTLVMENLKEQGYKLADRYTFYDLDYCKAALDALALFHANSLMYEELKSKELGRTYRLTDEYGDVLEERFYILGDTKGIGYRYLESSKGAIIELAKLMPESEEWKTSLMKRIQNFDPATEIERVVPSRKALGHGDLWANNMFYRHGNNNKSLECCLVDFQMLRYHHPALDVMLMIFTCTTRAFKKQHLQDMFQYYYQRLSDNFKEHDMDVGQVLTKEEFLKSAKVYEPLALMHAIAERPIVLLPADLITEAINACGDGLENLWLNDRAKMCTESFKNNEELRNIYMDFMYDLYETV